MNKKTVKTVIQDILNAHAGHIKTIPDDIHEESSVFTLEGPHGSTLRIDMIMPDVKTERELLDEILYEIFLEAEAFNIDNEFDNVYERGQFTPPSIVMDHLKEDEAYFQTITVDSVLKEKQASQNQETVKAVIQNIIDEHGGFINSVPGDHSHIDENLYEFYIQGPNGTLLFVDVVIPDDVQNKEAIKEITLDKIRKEAFAFDVDEEFNNVYHKNDPFPPSVFIDYLREDEEYFQNI